MGHEYIPYCYHAVKPGDKKSRLNTGFLKIKVIFNA